MHPQHPLCHLHFKTSGVTISAMCLCMQSTNSFIMMKKSFWQPDPVKTSWVLSLWPQPSRKLHLPFGLDRRTYVHTLVCDLHWLTM